MPIVVDVDVMLARRKMSVGRPRGARRHYARRTSPVLKNGRAKAVRFTTLAALCEALECQPGDLLRWDRVRTSVAGDPVVGLRPSGEPELAVGGGVRLVAGVVGQGVVAWAEQPSGLASVGPPRDQGWSWWA